MPLERSLGSTIADTLQKPEAQGTELQEDSEKFGGGGGCLPKPGRSPWRKISTQWPTAYSELRAQVSFRVEGLGFRVVLRV